MRDYYYDELQEISSLIGKTDLQEARKAESYFMTFVDEASQYGLMALDDAAEKIPDGRTVEAQVLKPVLKAIVDGTEQGLTEHIALCIYSSRVTGALERLKSLLYIRGCMMLAIGKSPKTIRTALMDMISITFHQEIDSSSIEEKGTHDIAEFCDDASNAFDVSDDSLQNALQIYIDSLNDKEVAWIIRNTSYELLAWAMKGMRGRVIKRVARLLPEYAANEIADIMAKDIDSGYINLACMKIFKKIDHDGVMYVPAISGRIESQAMLDRIDAVIS